MGSVGMTASDAYSESPRYTLVAQEFIRADLLRDAAGNVVRLVISCGRLDRGRRLPEDRFVRHGSWWFGRRLPGKRSKWQGPVVSDEPRPPLAAQVGTHQSDQRVPLANGCPAPEQKTPAPQDRRHSRSFYVI